MKLNVVELPAKNVGDVPRALRALADQIEAGEYGDAHNLAWAIDCGDSRLEIGMSGYSAEPGILAHFLFARAMRKLEDA